MNTPPLVFTLFSVILTLTACSSAPNNKTTAKTVTPQQQEVQQGTVLAVKYTTSTDNNTTEHNGKIGVTIGSGGSSGVYGSVDIGRVFNVFSSGKSAHRASLQTITVKRRNGEVVAITQPIVTHFNRGDRVKIVKQGNEARVIH